MCKKDPKGFNLIELLVVIGIICLLVAIVVPVASKVFEKGYRAKAASNLRQIGLAYLSYKQEHMRHSGELKTPQDWAVELAYYAELNEASLYYVDGDSAHSGKPLAKSVLLDLEDIDSRNPDFQNLSLSYTFVVNVPLNAPAATTPIGWTRGLIEDGRWAKDSPYGGKGGHILYLDGHVEWHGNFLQKGALLKYGTGITTKNIFEAISPPGKVLES